MLAGSFIDHGVKAEPGLSLSTMCMYIRIYYIIYIYIYTYIYTYVYTYVYM